MPKDPDTAPPASASERAEAMRERLGAQRVADDLLAEASQLRGAAAADAHAIVAEAESVAEQLLTEARETADKLATEAQERADGILARAYFEAEDLQRHTEEERSRIRDEVQSASRAEIEEFRTRSAGFLDSAESGLRDLAPSLEDAVATVVGVLRSLDELRNGPPDDQTATDDQPALRELTVSPEPIAAEETAAVGAPTARLDDPEARPLGWLFRASQG
jgi:vacuolar-type H+-ATPase subunit H